MMKLNIHHWLTLKWQYMSLGHQPLPVFKGYINALSQFIANNLTNTEDNEPVH